MFRSIAKFVLFYSNHFYVLPGNWLWRVLYVLLLQFVHVVNCSASLKIMCDYYILGRSAVGCFSENVEDSGYRHYRSMLIISQPTCILVHIFWYIWMLWLKPICLFSCYCSLMIYGIWSIIRFINVTTPGLASASHFWISFSWGSVADF